MAVKEDDGAVDGVEKSEEGEDSKDVKTENVDGHDEMDIGPETHAAVIDGNGVASVRAEAPSTNGEASSPPQSTPKSPPKRSNEEMRDEDGEDDDEPVRKRSRRTAPQEKPKQSAKAKSVEPKKDRANMKAAPSKAENKELEPKQSSKTTNKSSAKTSSEQAKAGSTEAVPSSSTAVEADDEEAPNETASEMDEDEAESEEEDKPEVAAKAREKVQSTLKSSGKDPYPDWKPGEPVPYAALCTTFSLIEMTTKRLIISAHCSLFLRQVLRLTPQDLLPTVQLMINKLAADYAGIELGIGESLIMKAIGESTGRSLQIIKADQNEIGDLGLVAAKSRSNQPTMFKPKP